MFPISKVNWIVLLFGLFSICLFVSIVIYILKFDKESLIYLNEKYFVCYSKNIEHKVEWNNLIINSVRTRWPLPVRIILMGKKNDPSFSYKIVFNFFTMVGLVEAIKKYTPKEHELHKKMVEFYPKHFSE